MRGTLPHPGRESATIALNTFPRAVARFHPGKITRSSSSMPSLQQYTTPVFAGARASACTCRANFSGCQRSSASHGASRSPAVMDAPRLRAAAVPRCGPGTARILRSRRAASAMTPAVPSVDPSSTTTISMFR